MLNVTNLVTNKNKQPVTSSRVVAKCLNRNHYHVMRTIRSIIKGVSKSGDPLKLFAKSTIHKDHQSYPIYYMNRDGFSLLMMSFNNSAKVLSWKLKFIHAFDVMQKKLADPLAKYKGMDKGDMLISLGRTMKHNHALALKKRQMKPTYNFGKGISANTDHTYTTKEAAHIFSKRFNLKNCGVVNFNRLLRSAPMAIISNQHGKNRNLPAKYYEDHHWCVVHYSHIISPFQHKKVVYRTVYYMAKGVKGIIDKFLKNRIFIPYRNWNPAYLDSKWLDRNYIYKNKRYLEYCGLHLNRVKIKSAQDK